MYLYFFKQNKWLWMIFVAVDYRDHQHPKLSFKHSLLSINSSKMKLVFIKMMPPCETPSRTLASFQNLTTTTDLNKNKTEPVLDKWSSYTSIVTGSVKPHEILHDHIKRVTGKIQCITQVEPWILWGSTAEPHSSQVKVTSDKTARVMTVINRILLMWTKGFKVHKVSRQRGNHVINQ